MYLMNAVMTEPLWINHHAPATVNHAPATAVETEAAGGAQGSEQPWQQPHQRR